MADSYDDKIETMLVTRRRMSEQRKATRQKEIQKELCMLGGGILAVIIIVVILFQACGGDKSSVGNKEKTTTTTVEVKTTAVSNEDETTVSDEETTLEDRSDLSGRAMFTTDVLNFRAEPSTDAELVNQIPKGARVKVISSDGDWCNITYNKQKGYVKQEFLSETKPES